MDKRNAMGAGLFALLVLAFAAGAQAVTYISGNLVIEGDAECIDSTIVMNSSSGHYIRVTDTGSLTLDNCTITAEGYYRIEVYGDISVEDSTIERLDTSAMTLYSGANVLGFGDVTFRDGTASRSVKTAVDITLTGDVSTDAGLFEITANGVTIDG